MRELKFIRQFERQLVESGCPAAKVRRHVQEMAEHHEDLRAAAIAGGCCQAEAEARANERLGDPIELADSIMAVSRNCSWWGRHPFIGFCVLPLPVLLPAWMAANLLFLLFCWLLYVVAGPAVSATDLFTAAKSDPSITTELFALMRVLLSALPPACEAAFFAWMARRAGLRVKWALIACGICSLIASFMTSMIAPDKLGVRFGAVPENGIAPFGPVLFGLVLLARQRRMEQECEDDALRMA